MVEEQRGGGGQEIVGIDIASVSPVHRDRRAPGPGAVSMSQSPGEIALHLRVEPGAGDVIAASPPRNRSAASSWVMERVSLSSNP